MGPSEWTDLKATCPFKQLPVLEVDSVQVAQSLGLMQYAGTLAGLVPKDPLTAAIGNSIILTLDDIHMAAAKWRYGKEEDMDTVG